LVAAEPNRVGLNVIDEEAGHGVARAHDATVDQGKGAVAGPRNASEFDWTDAWYVGAS